MTSWLIDKSALVRVAASADAEDWAGRIERGLVRISTVTRLEVGYSARTGQALRDATRRPPLSSMPVEYQTPVIEDRAGTVRPGQPRTDRAAAHSPAWRLDFVGGASRPPVVLLP